MGSNFGNLNNLVYPFENDIIHEELFKLPKSDPAGKETWVLVDIELKAIYKNALD